jgi:hypothetical protein
LRDLRPRMEKSNGMMFARDGVGNRVRIGLEMGS